jgi:hypothetical protein
MLQDSSFANELKCAYNQYRETVLSFEYLTSFIDSVGGLVQNAQARHFQKWPILGISGPAPEVAPYPASYLAELQALKGWIELRLNWLDANMPGNCYLNSNSVSDVKPNSELSVFPNPAVNKIQFSGITAEMGVQRIKIIDLAGRTVDSINVKSTDNSVEINITARGAYTFIVEGKAGIISTGKIVVVE